MNIHRPKHRVRPDGPLQFGVAILVGIFLFTEPAQSEMQVPSHKNVKINRLTESSQTFEPGCLNVTLEKFSSIRINAPKVNQRNLSVPVQIEFHGVEFEAIHEQLSLPCDPIMVVIESGEGQLDLAAPPPPASSTHTYLQSDPWLASVKLAEGPHVLRAFLYLKEEKSRPFRLHIISPPVGVIVK